MLPIGSIEMRMEIVLQSTFQFRDGQWVNDCVNGPWVCETLTHLPADPQMELLRRTIWFQFSMKLTDIPHMCEVSPRGILFAIIIYIISVFDRIPTINVSTSHGDMSRCIDNP